MSARISRFVLASLLVLLAQTPLSVAAKNSSLPDSLSAAIIAKVLSFETSSLGESVLRIHVYDNESLADELRDLIGVQVGERRLDMVTSGTEVPDKADVVVASGKTAMNDAIRYAQENGAVSVSNNPKLIELGVSLVVFDDEGLPGILLSRNGAKREGLYWRPEILEIAKLAD